MGTPGYAPVEQAGYKQDGSIPATLDVYALGATMFKMLTGLQPPEATIILNEGFPVQELTTKSISEKTRAAVKKAMSPIRKHRFQTVKAFIDAFEEEITEPETEPVPEPETVPMPEPEPKQQTQDEVEVALTATKPYKWIWILCVGVIITVIAVWRNSPPAQPTENDFTVEVAETPETPSAIKDIATNMVSDMEWDSPLGKAIYTGQVTHDSIAGSNKSLPHGKGVAIITDGPYVGYKYDGIFERGNMNGYAFHVDQIGDTFWIVCRSSY